MIRLLFLSLILFSFLDSSTKNIDKKITSNKKILEKSKSTQMKTDFLIKILAKQISKQNKELTDLEKDIDIVNDDIIKHEAQLKDARSQLTNLQKNSKTLIKEKKRMKDK